MRLIGLALLLWAAASCGGPTGPSAALLAENLAALENTVDTESRETDADTCLEFVQPLVDLGEVPMAESRSAVVAAVNRTDAPLVVLDARASCDCTTVAWNRAPVAAHDTLRFEVRFTAEQPGAFFKKIVVRHSAAARPVSFAVQGFVGERTER